MVPVWFLGVAFRSEGHFEWFLLSMLIFFVHVTLQLRHARLKGVARDPTNFVLFHLTTSLMAILKTHLGTINTPVWSIDCIWFNPLMAAAHGCLWYVAVRLVRRSA